MRDGVVSLKGTDLVGTVELELDLELEALVRFTEEIVLREAIDFDDDWF